MRVSHFVEIGVAVATFIATYSLFEGRQHFASLSESQVGNIPATIVEKADRLAVKDDQE